MADESGAVDHVGLVINDGLDHQRVVGRVVLEIGVLDDHDIAGRRCDSGPQRSALAAVRLQVDDPGQFSIDIFLE